MSGRGLQARGCHVVGNERYSESGGGKVARRRDLSGLHRATWNESCTRTSFEDEVRQAMALGAHRHVLDYFWSAIAAGNSRQHTADGTTRDVSYVPGETHHYTFGPGEYLLHDLENIGDTELIFSTVEFLDGHDKPLPLS